VLRIRIRMFWGLLDTDPLVRGTDTDPALDPSTIKQKTLIATALYFSLNNDVNVASKSNKQNNI
jgi:hypothetical protein